MIDSLLIVCINFLCRPYLLKNRLLGFSCFNSRLVRLYVGEKKQCALKFSIKGFFSECDQGHSFLRIWSHSLKKSLMENFIFCTAVGIS